MSEHRPALEKQKLLFVCDEVPARSGSGTPMRAASHIQILSEFFEITLGIIGGVVRGVNNETLVPANLRKLCKSIIVINRTSMIVRLLRRAPTVQVRVLLQALWPTPFLFGRNGPALSALADRLAGQSFDAVHCFRLNTGRAPQLLRRRGVGFGRSVLDFDAYESRMAFRSARPVMGLNGRQLAAVQWLDGVKWAALESLLIPKFDDVFLCSELDCAKLRWRFPKNRWHAVPNIIAEPIKAVTRLDDRFTFLFVGLLSYPPNADAITFYCTKVLPILRRYIPSAFRILIVGREPGELLKLNALEDVEVIGDPPDISPYYAQADVAIVPLRAGGGTRIKILEAFSYGIPVVSTTIGAEGLEVIPDTNILIADRPEHFADQCYRIWTDPSLRQRIAAAGHDLWRTRYDPSALRRALACVYGSES